MILVKIITKNYNYIPIFRNPIKSIKRKIHSIKFSNENYTENFIELKEKKKEKFKQLGSEPYQRLTI